MTASQCNKLCELVDAQRRAIEASREPMINSEFCIGYKRWNSRGEATGMGDHTHRIEIYARCNHQQDLREILQLVGLNDELEATGNQVKAIFYRSI